MVLAMIDKNDPRLTAYVLGELSVEEIAELKSAIENSTELQNVVRKIETSVAFLKRELAAEIPITKPVSTSLPKKSFEKQQRSARWPWAVAATLLLTIIGYGLFTPPLQRVREAAVRTEALSDYPVLAPSASAVPNSDPRALIRRETFDRFQSGKSSAPLPVMDAELSYLSGDHMLEGQVEIELTDFDDLSGMGGGMGGRGEMGGGGGMMPGDRYDAIVENDFLRPINEPLSTFSIDVDTASYSKVRSYLLNYNQLPPAGAVRLEELINYFVYNYAPPTDGTPFAVHQAVASCPWNPKHKLVRIALKGREIKQDQRPVSNLVFLIDVSGSMNESNKLPLVKQGVRMLVEQLTENDRVAMVVYAGAAGKVLDSTTGDQKSVILGALDRLQAGGSTNGGAGIHLAYQMAVDNFITGGVNRVILCSDGDFNVGTTSNDELVRLVEEQAKKNVFLSVLGFGTGNLNDSMLEQISNRGNGNYAFIDTESEARKVLVEQMSGTLVTIAKDVKIQVEFNPAVVGAYRLVGYENRIMAAQDFNNDKKDAGEIGAGHTVTALYEIIPAGEELASGTNVDALKYQSQAEPRSSSTTNQNELLTLKLRYKLPEVDTSQLLEFPLQDSNQSFNEADKDFQFAAAVASFGMQLRDSKYAGTTSLDAILEIAQSASEFDPFGYRREFVSLVQSARALRAPGAVDRPQR